METFSDRLLREHSELWCDMQFHPLVTGIEQQQLPAEVFNRYLTYEGDFVATAVDIFTLAVLYAPDMPRKRRMIRGLYALTETQISWFNTKLEKRGICREDYYPAPAGVSRFSDWMAETARLGSYSDIILIMFGAEWMYYHWCHRVAQQPSEDEDIREWVEMHAAEEFYSQACWLKAEVDRLGEAGSDSEKQQLSLLYGQVLQREIDFHHAAFG